ncbi:hypothetical protein GCM10010168_37850 [Actinoplanes ianthinogenes]|uniref:Uncharacterized protein n=1 Tax=Actinoplanes ianthinogenes TaxID=122358 RepID=A0ABM7M4Z2_9ACTN|nr:hypothetical protein [Actinoplanes ianthinogenes]BCJ46693.1 hypothetical protein Aiant_73500 [Actinoplanes ianthinogenes]GGR16304.1 hypothetical protein GCM10010168_37850 [Actinoplanes ianthinogenes]
MTISQLVRGVATTATIAGLLSAGATPAAAAPRQAQRHATPAAAPLPEANHHEPPTSTATGHHEPPTGAATSHHQPPTSTTTGHHHEPPTGTALGHRPRPQHLTDAQRKTLLAATHHFRDVRQAIKAGYLPTEDCVPGMGLHYANPKLTTATRINPAKPPILLYLPTKHGAPQLTGLEYFHADADGDVHTDNDRPDLFGHPFDGPMEGHHVPPGAPPMPVHYDMHVWLYLQNPDGELTTLNPKITC